MMASGPGIGSADVGFIVINNEIPLEFSEFNRRSVLGEDIFLL